MYKDNIQRILHFFTRENGEKLSCLRENGKFSISKMTFIVESFCHLDDPII